MNDLRDSLMAVVHSKRVWLLQFLLNPALFALASLWLLIPEAHAWQIVATVMAILLVVLIFLWLQSATLEYFDTFHAEGSARLRESFKPANMVAFAVWAVVFAFLIHFVNHVGNEIAFQLSTYLRSSSPNWLRRMISQDRMDALVALKFWVLLCIVIPGLLLPLGLQTAKLGFGGFGKEGRRAWRHTLGSRVYWSVLIVLAIVGIYVPSELINWMPEMSSITGEAVSLTLRLLSAWFLAASSWTMLVSILGRLGKPDRTRDITG